MWYGARIAALGAAIMFVGLDLIPLVLVAAREKWSDARAGFVGLAVQAGYAGLAAVVTWP